jgi:hypothetical protein
MHYLTHFVPSNGAEGVEPAFFACKDAATGGVTRPQKNRQRNKDRQMRIVGVLSLLMMFFLAATAMADEMTFTTSSTGVYYAVNDGGYFVSPSAITTANAYAKTSGSNFELYADGSGYSDAGIVLYFGGGLTLGDISNISIAGTNLSSVAVNLWLDTSGDGSFFAFSGDTLTSLNGDSYSGCGGGGSIDGTSSCYMLGGNGAGSTYTLSQLQSGADPGIDANTPAALWIGLVDSPSPNLADISSVTVTSPVPEPGSVALVATVGLLLGLGRMRSKRKQRPEIGKA